MVQLPHRSFQEYLAACHLTDDEFPEKLAELARNDPNRWCEVALLAGAKAARGSTLSAWALAEALCLDAPPAGQGAHYEPDHWGALLAGQVLAECADPAQVAPRNRQKLANIRAWQIAVMRRNPLPAVERALAGRTLATLGNPRLDVTTLAGMDFCYVPPGAFTMGDDRNDNEKPQHRVDLAYPYFIARFPVSVAQWREYVEHSGHAPGDASSLHGRGNDPVVHVSWQEALRFCDFLTQAWREMLPADWVVTLPSEAEWEKAARGGERIPVNSVPVTARQLDERLKAAADEARNPLPRRDYPWGEGFDENRANTATSSIGETSAVGCYPLGASPYGCEEMSGNVWEWTRSLWGKSWMKSEFAYPYDPEDRRREDANAGEAVLRVVRGGSWIGLPDYARCASRNGGHPVVRVDFLGFRVVLRSSPV